MARCSSWCRSSSRSSIATVTGLVGAIGGLGGFFPPLLLGFFRDRIGVVWPGFGLLALTAAGLWVLNARLFLPRQRAIERGGAPLLTSRQAEQLRAGAWATMATALLVAAIVVGSRNLQNFDPALVIYTFAVIVATWGIVYHYAIWLNKPPTRRFFERTFELMRAEGPLRSARVLVGTTFGDAHARADVHPQAVAAALVDAPVRCSGAACSRSRSRSRWSSAGSISGRRPTTR